MKETAGKCGTSLKIYWNWENGKGTPIRNNRRVIAEVFYISEEDITDRAYEFIRDWVMANSTQFTDDAGPPRFGIGGIAALLTAKCFRCFYSGNIVDTLVETKKGQVKSGLREYVFTVSTKN